MEVASPLTFGHAGTKRSMACSPELMDASELVSTATAMENVNTERLAKRRRFDNTTVESLSEDFSAHGIFFHKSLSSNNNKNKKTIFGSNGAQSLKLFRPRSRSPSPAREELNRIVQEQARIMETLKSEKAELQGKFETLKTDHERVVKENQILRKAVTIQQERFNTAENEVKSVKAHASDRIKSLESIISQLRYHLQAHQNIGNDFMNQLPPDVY